MALADFAEWHGFAAGENAIYISPMDEDQVGLFMQAGRSTQLCAVFVDPALAVMVMDWLDDSLQATARANSALLARLEADQPLAFAQPLPQDDLPDDTEELGFPDGAG